MKAVAAVAILSEPRKTDLMLYLSAALLGVSIVLCNYYLSAEEQAKHPVEAYLSKILTRMDMTYSRLVEWEAMDLAHSS